MKECLLAGSELNLVDGLIGDAGRQAVAVAEEQGLFDLSTLKDPTAPKARRPWGLKSSCNWAGGCPMPSSTPPAGAPASSDAQGFQELLELGWVEGTPPKFFAVQPVGCQPIVRAFHAGEQKAEAWQNAETIADGLRVPGPFADYLILQALRESGGTALAVEDDDMVQAMYELATTEGIIACPEGAATLVGLKRLVQDGFWNKDDTIVLLNTGSGYKYMELVRK